MIANACHAASQFGFRTLTALIAMVAAGASIAVAQPPSLADDEKPLGRRAAVQYKVSSSPLSLTEVKPPVSPYEAERFRLTQRSYVLSPMVLHAALAQPGVASLSVFRNSTDKVDWLKEHLLVTFPGDGDIMEIAVADAKAPEEDLVALANAVSKAYFDEVVFSEQSQRTLPLQILQVSSRRLSESLQRKSDTLRQLEVDHGFDAASTAKRQWLTDEAWLLRQRVEELRAQHFDEKLRRLQADPVRQEGSSDKAAEERDAAIDELFATEAKRLKAQLDETLASSAANAPASSTDLDLRRQEIACLRETETWLTRRIQLLQIEIQGPNRVNPIGSKGGGSATVEFYDK